MSTHIPLYNRYLYMVFQFVKNFLVSDKEISRERMGEKENAWNALPMFKSHNSNDKPQSECMKVSLQKYASVSIEWLNHPANHNQKWSHFIQGANVERQIIEFVR